MGFSAINQLFNARERQRGDSKRSLINRRTERLEFVEWKTRKIFARWQGKWKADNCTEKTKNFRETQSSPLLSRMVPLFPAENSALSKPFDYPKKSKSKKN